uniref:Uncharacterized protein n=1 Tax=Anopheles culicifacies TaxID=139723 RepID=A0A182M5T8_9DIPT
MSYNNRTRAPPVYRGYLLPNIHLNIICKYFTASPSAAEVQELMNPFKIVRHFRITIGVVSTTQVNDEVGHTNQLSGVYRRTARITIARPIATLLVDANQTRADAEAVFVLHHKHRCVEQGGRRWLVTALPTVPGYHHFTTERNLLIDQLDRLDVLVKVERFFHLQHSDIVLEGAVVFVRVHCPHPEPMTSGIQVC